MAQTSSPQLCRLEVYDRRTRSWQVTQAAVSLLHPDRYPARFAAHGKMARATVLDDRLQPTGEVYAVDGADLL